MHLFEIFLKLVELGAKLLSLFSDCLELGLGFGLRFEIVSAHEVCSLLLLAYASVRVAIVEEVVQGLRFLVLFFISLGILLNFGLLALLLAGGRVG